jgi:hypothetical protein
MGPHRARLENDQRVSPGGLFRFTLIVAVMLGLAAPLGARGSSAAIVTDEMPLYERSSLWRCEVRSKFLCFDDVCRRFAVADRPGAGGEDRPRYWMELDFLDHAYTRCDRNGCDRKDMGTSTAGAFTLVEPGDGAFMKIGNGDFEFVDVATMGTGVAASFGVCAPLEPFRP